MLSRLLVERHVSVYRLRIEEPMCGLLEVGFRCGGDRGVNEAA